MSIIETLDHFTSLGFKIEFERVFNNQNSITCTRNNNNFSSIIPDDHYYEDNIVNIIIFNVSKILKKEKL